MKLVIFICLMFCFGCTKSEPKMDSYHQKISDDWDATALAYYKPIFKLVNKLEAKDIEVRNRGRAFNVGFLDYSLYAADTNGTGEFFYILEYKGNRVPLGWEYNNNIFDVLKRKKVELQGKNPGQIAKEREVAELKEILESGN